jgi:uncharacterized membrane-anchored protein
LFEKIQKFCVSHESAARDSKTMKRSERDLVVLDEQLKVFLLFLLLSRISSYVGCKQLDIGVH